MLIALHLIPFSYSLCTYLHCKGEEEYRREFNEEVVRLFGSPAPPTTTTDGNTAPPATATATGAATAAAASTASRGRKGNPTAAAASTTGAINENNFEDSDDDDEDDDVGATTNHLTGTLTDLITTYVEYGRSLEHFLTAAQMAVARLNVVDHVLTEEMFADR